MPFTFELRFSGACAFVPRRQKGKAWVLLVNQEKEEDMASSVEEAIPLHKSIVKWKLENSYASNVPTKEDSFGLWFLDGDDIQILPGGIEMPKERWDLSVEDFNLETGRAAGEGSAPSRKSFTWVAPVEDACASRGFSYGGRIYPELLRQGSTKDPVSFPVSLAARVHLDTGMLSSRRISQHEKKDIIWRFRPFNGDEAVGDHRQLLASEVSLSILVPDGIDYVALRSKFLKDGLPKAELKLYPVDKSEPLIVWIMNEESAAALGCSRHQKVVPKTPRVQDRIFEMFAKLSPYSPPLSEMPIPVADYIVDRQTEGTAVLSPPCSPARTTSVDEGDIV